MNVTKEDVKEAEKKYRVLKKDIRKGKHKPRTFSIGKYNIVSTPEDDLLAAKANISTAKIQKINSDEWHKFAKEHKWTSSKDKDIVSPKQ